MLLLARSFLKAVDGGGGEDTHCSVDSHSLYSHALLGGVTPSNSTTLSLTRTLWLSGGEEGGGGSGGPKKDATAAAAATAVAAHATSRILRLNTFLFEAGIDNINLIRLQVRYSSAILPPGAKRAVGSSGRVAGKNESGAEKCGVPGGIVCFCMNSGTSKTPKCCSR